MSSSRRHKFAPRPPLPRPSTFAVESLEERRLFAWGPQGTLIGQDLAAAKGLFGAGTSIAILDTGIDYMHPRLGGGFGPGYKVSAGWDFVDNDADPMDTHGHGTAVAGMAAGLNYTQNGQEFQGIARDADLIALRVDTAAGLSWNVQKFVIEKALQWVIAHRTEHNIVAVNMSFGFGAARMTDSPFNDELQTLGAAGVFLAAAAGNSGTQNVDYPAIDPSVYAIGGVSPNGSIWASSSRGANVDLLAPADNLTVLWYYPGQANPHGYIVNSADGTSFAAPQAAGLAAVLRQIDPTLTPGEMLSIMQSTGDAVSDGTRSYSRINVNRAIAEAYRLRDDASEDNDGSGAAKSLAFDSGGAASLSGLKLLVNDPDWYRFTLGKQSDVDWALSLGGGTAPTVDLIDVNGNVIKRLAGTDQARLNAGTYYIRVNAPSATLAGTYGIGLVATPVADVPPPPPPPPPAPGTNGSSNGIAYDSAGRLHLAYYDEATKNLKYAVRGTDGVWGATVVVDAGLMAGQFVSLQLDSQGRAGIAYYDANQADLKYAQYTGSSWAVQTVDAQFTTGYYPSLQYGAGDAPVISYYSKTGGDLKLAAWVGTGWALSTIDSAGDVGRYSSLAYNPASGRWAVAYEDTGHGTFKYAEQGKSGWTPVTVDASTKIGGGYISLAFNPKTKLPALSYYDAYNADLKFASFSGTRWTTQAVATKGTVGLYSTLLIDATTGLADILYYNKGTDVVLRARQGASAWSLTQVTTDGGRWISRAVQADGDETLAYLSAGEVTVIDL